MKKIIIAALIIFLIPWGTMTQTWTDPINISNLPGLDNQPDLCIDKNGTLHCVFTHKLGNNWRKIYYAKSTDDGLTWTTPEDISLNDDLSLMNPHIVADTNNILYISYDYNTGNPYQTMVFIKKFNGNLWEEPVNITPNEPESHSNDLVVDYNNRIYCFYAKGGYHSKIYYKYFENELWTETICPYPGNHYWALSDVSVDQFNNLHCIGMYHGEGQPHEEDQVIYFKYEYDLNWTDKTFLTERTAWQYGNEIDIDNQDDPHVAYRRKDPYSTGPDDDSTMYRYYDGNWWSLPDLVISDPGHQRIVIDPYNRIHIFDKEKMEIGSKLIHYNRVNGLWVGYLLDSSYLNISNPDILELNNNLYFTYYKCFSDTDCKIRFMKNNLITDIHLFERFVDNYVVYPNPFQTQTTIEFKLINERQIEISVFELSGNKIITLMNENKKPGEYRLIWNGKDLNGKEVMPGLYLVRLQSGRNLVTQPVEIIK